MKHFLIITNYGRYIVEAEDIEDAVHKAYNNHYGYNHFHAVVCIDEDDS